MGVVDDQRLVAFEREVAKRLPGQLSRCRNLRRKADLADIEVALGFHDRNKTRRHTQKPCRQTRGGVERLFGKVGELQARYRRRPGGRVDRLSGV